MIGDSMCINSDALQNSEKYKKKPVIFSSITGKLHFDRRKGDEALMFGSVAQMGYLFFYES